MVTFKPLPFFFAFPRTKNRSICQSLQNPNRHSYRRFHILPETYIMGIRMFTCRQTQINTHYLLPRAHSQSPERIHSIWVNFAISWDLSSGFPPIFSQRFNIHFNREFRILFPVLEETIPIFDNTSNNRQKANSTGTSDRSPCGGFGGWGRWGCLRVWSGLLLWAGKPPGLVVAAAGDGLGLLCCKPAFFPFFLPLPPTAQGQDDGSHALRRVWAEPWLNRGRGGPACSPALTCAGSSVHGAHGGGSPAARHRTVCPDNSFSLPPFFLFSWLQAWLRQNPWLGTML